MVMGSRPPEAGGGDGAWRLPGATRDGSWSLPGEMMASVAGAGRRDGGEQCGSGRRRAYGGDREVAAAPSEVVADEAMTGRGGQGVDQSACLIWIEWERNES